jgi:hypothetical protein
MKPVAGGEATGVYIHKPTIEYLLSSYCRVSAAFASFC